MRVLIAFDKFKDAITAREACEVTAQALRQAQPTWQLDLCPLTDGGDGFEEIVGDAVGALRVPVQVTGPRGAVIASGFRLAPLHCFPQPACTELLGLAELGDQAPIAIIEMARASGLALLQAEQRDPWQTTTYGTGQLIRAAADRGAEAIILGIGGSATNDLGLGALNALGLKFRNADGKEVSPGSPRQWHEIALIEGAKELRIPPLLIASDVTNPLLGPRGAAAIYGPQKGLRPESLHSLESASVRMAQMLCAECEMPTTLAELPGAGAAGGIAFGLLCTVGARLRSGFTFTAACLDLTQRLQEADLVITGEGEFDESSQAGKGPGEIARLARILGKPVHLFAGRILARQEETVIYHEISPPDVIDRRILDKTAANLAQKVAAVFHQ